MTEEQGIIVDDIGEIEAESVKSAEEAKIEAKTDDDSLLDIPEKYRGKDIKTLVKMNLDAQEMINKQASEVGEIRKLADELIRSQLVKPVEVKQEKPKEVDFFENPQEAIRLAVENNPKVLAAEQYALQVQREQNRQKLIQNHPDALEVSNSPEFVEWVRASKVRSKLFEQANNQWDYESADELIGTWKQLKRTKMPEVSAEEKQARETSLKSASVSASGAGESGKKVYRRADLIMLQLRDPLKHAAMQSEIDAAYREGRVR